MIKKFFIFIKFIFSNVIRCYLFIVILSFIAIFFRLFMYQVIDSKKAIEEINNSRYKEYSIKAKRGDIISADGQVLTFDLIKYVIVVSPSDMDEEYYKQIVNILSKDLDIDNSKLLTEIQKKRALKSRYYVVTKNADYSQVEKLKIDLKDIRANITKKYKKARKKEEQKEWLTFDSYPVRYNIQKKDFQNIVGYLNEDRKAIYGLEKYYDKKLNGEDGILKYYVPSAKSKYDISLPSLLNTKVLKEAKKGDSLYLNIDSVLQTSLNDIVEKTYRDTNAETVMAILMEPNTGNILAMSSYPLAKNEGFIKNLPITDLFEPGSIFKPITVSSAMQMKLIDENTLISSKGYIAVKNRVIHDHDSSTVGTFPVSKIVALSGNVAMVKIAMLMETSDFYNFLVKYGLAQKTGIDLSYETYGRLFPQKDFSDVRKSNVAFGQGINMTQLQMITALNATINGGKIYKPHIVKYITDSNGKVIEDIKPEIVAQVIDENISKKIRNILRDVVVFGTGRKVDIPGYELGGKTGTAQKAGRGGYIKGEYFSSFYSFFPADKPQYSLIVTVNDPKGLYYGAQVALPAVKQMFEKLIAYKKIKPFVKVNDMSENSKININSKEEIKQSINLPNKLISSVKNGIMPNLKGLSREQLEKLFPSNIYSNVKYIGTGKLINQSIAPGKKFDKNKKIYLELR